MAFWIGFRYTGWRRRRARLRRRSGDV